MEDHARKQVDRANNELVEARRERDEAIQELNAIQLREKDLELREKDWELSIKSVSLCFGNYLGTNITVLYRSLNLQCVATFCALFVFFVLNRRRG